MLRLRIVSISLAALICGGIVLYAVSAKFRAITDLFEDQDAIKVEVKEKEKPPPPPPPPPPDRPPPPPPPMMQIVNPDPTAEAVVTDIPMTISPPPPVLPPPAPPQITAADFIERPDGNAFSRYYPSRAQERDKNGLVRVRCAVNASGRLVSCTILSEEPSGWGFGDATVRMAQREFRVRPQTVNGQPTDGGTITFPVRWRLPEG
jgi:protein TonB